MFIKAKPLRKTEPSTLADVLEKWIQTNHLGEKMALTDVKEAWCELMGPAIARHTRRLRIENKILKIEVDNAPLRQQLAMSRNRIVRLVNEKVGRNLIADCLIY